MKFEKRILTSIFLFFLVFPYNVFAKFNLTAIIRNNLLENVNEVYSTLNIALKKIESTNIRNAYLKIDYVGKSNQLLKSAKNPLAYDEILKCFVADDPVRQSYFDFKITRLGIVISNYYNVLESMLDLVTTNESVVFINR